ncbi:hypothetical protein ACWN8V_00470 [Vagococcus elongatus]|uniref:Uncharacterized protein n=1 Tax=Vagococcus elongatus TaxID=180344 RepID=A0A430B5L5_9ENTE|nr:hypothetical protein [Vagococcus elongatus]RSU15581.1 hypothetical protein CBF29_00460 [Vagococcus elongatus]
MKNKPVGIFLIIVSVLILLFSPSFVFPQLGEGSYDHGEYYLKIIVNFTRLVLISSIFSIVGIKLYFKK